MTAARSKQLWTGRERTLDASALTKALDRWQPLNLTVYRVDPGSDFVAVSDSVVLGRRALMAYRRRARAGAVVSLLASIGFLTAASLTKSWMFVSAAVLPLTLLLIGLLDGSERRSRFVLERERLMHGWFGPAEVRRWIGLPVLLLVLLTACHAWFWWGIGERAPEALALSAAGLAAGEPWRVLTAPVLHRDLLHVAFNAMLTIPACIVLHGRRPWQLAAVFAAAAIGGLLVQVAWAPERWTAGSSAGSFALLGWAVGETARASGIRRGALLPQLLGIVAISLAFGALQAGTANVAHVAGLAIGTIFACASQGPAAR